MHVRPMIPKDYRKVAGVFNVAGWNDRTMNAAITLGGHLPENVDKFSYSNLKSGRSGLGC
jgi:hypothetical protein